MQNLISKLFKGSTPYNNEKELTRDGLLKSGYNQVREKSNIHSVCFAPSVNMLFGTDGSVRACCHNSENTLGHYPDNTINEIWNGVQAKAFRRAMEDYRFLSGCSGCALDYAEGHFDQMPALHFDTLPRRTDYPTMMEFLLDNTCNLECVMCSGELSSSIRKNRDKLPAIKSPYGKAFVEQLQEFIPYLKETRFSGAGEAFSIDIYYQLWQTLIQKNPECLLVVQTNGTILNARVRDYLAQGKFQIGVSLDSLQKETFETIRINALFEMVMRNIEYFADYSHRNNRVFTISTCVMRQNWQELPDFVNYCNKTGAHIIFHKVWAPLSCSLFDLPYEELRYIYTTLSGFTFPSGTFLEKKNAGTYYYFLSVIERWMKEAGQREQSKRDWQSFSNDKLQSKINSDMQKYIQGQSMIETDKEQLTEMCQTKFNAVMELWTDDNERRETLLQLCSVQVSDVITSLKAYPVEKLYEMSKVNRK